MTVNELNSKIFLPSVITHFNWEVPKFCRKLPLVGWYGLSRDESVTFNSLDLYRYNVPSAPKHDAVAFIKECYRYYTIEHSDLFETEVRYSETNENKLVQDYLRKIINERFYRACRSEALEGS